MSDQVVVLDASPPSIEPSNRTLTSKRVRWFELVLVVSISFGQSVFASVQLLWMGSADAPHKHALQWAMSFFYEAACLALLGYVLWRRRLRFQDLGLRWSNAEILRGVGVAVGAYCLYWAGSFLVWDIHRAIFGAVHGGLVGKSLYGHPGIVAIPFFLLNPLFEELIVRAYVMTEITELTGSATLAVGVSVLLQTAYHLYYGWQGALSLAFMFLFFAVYYAKTRRATPVVLAHGAFDLWALFQLW